VVYSGLSNLLATFAFWLLKVYGHRDVRLLDGDRRKSLVNHDCAVTNRAYGCTTVVRSLFVASISKRLFMVRLLIWRQDMVASGNRELDHPGNSELPSREEYKYTKTIAPLS
jgi:hypothetical protein